MTFKMQELLPVQEVMVVMQVQVVMVAQVVPVGLQFQYYQMVFH